MNDFVKERHKAFAEILYNDDFSKMDKYCKKYRVPKPKSRKVQKAGVLKAIQYCTDFSEEEKIMAMGKCLEMGFSPFMEPYGYDEEEEWMDAVNFVREKARMCKSYSPGGKERICKKCALSVNNNGTEYPCKNFVVNHPEDAVRIVEEWSKEHAVVTNRRKFVEVFGAEPIMCVDLLCPPRGVRKADCKGECRECVKWWDEPYKEPEK